MARGVLALAIGGVLLAACDSSAPAEEAKTEEAKTVASAEAPTDTKGAAKTKARAKIEADAEEKAALDELLRQSEHKFVPMVPEDEDAKPATPTEPTTPAKPAPMSRPEPEPLALATPPFAYTLVREVPLAQDPRPTLKKISAKRNGITDEAAWFHTHGLSLPVWETPSGRSLASASPLPTHITETYRGEAIREAIKSAKHSIAIYSSARLDRKHAVVRDRIGDIVAALDFSAYTHTPKDLPEDLMFTDQQLQWAQVQDGVLFACTYHRTYARSSGGLNAFVTALDLPSGELLWQSDPLVCNSRNFLLRGGFIITGYGFTAERDFLYVLDARTGETVSKTKVASGPDVILEKGGELYVRTYDRDYVFAL